MWKTESVWKTERGFAVICFLRSGAVYVFRRKGIRTLNLWCYRQLSISNPIKITRVRFALLLIVDGNPWIDKDLFQTARAILVARGFLCGKTTPSTHALPLSFISKSFNGHLRAPSMELVCKMSIGVNVLQQTLPCII